MTIGKRKESVKNEKNRDVFMYSNCNKLYYYKPKMM